tara:strand:+ start:330 stop:485 length:156 start_codon:yes stop_codon:yes gene_type:complete
MPAIEVIEEEFILLECKYAGCATCPIEDRERCTPSCDLGEWVPKSWYEKER